MSARFLLDTSVYSQPLRNRPNLAALHKWKSMGDAVCRTCDVVVAEIEFGLHLENRPEWWDRYRALLQGRLDTLGVDRVVWGRFSRMKARQHQLGQMVADLDLLIAACAAHNGLTVVTLNHTDFSRIEGIVWEDWSR
jgi:tRNA(fMet)-specific endonuclease VapC